MVLFRTVFQAKIGKADELVAAFKESFNRLPADQTEALKPRILTDISGPFFTVVLETTHESLAAVEEFRNAMFADQEASEAADGTEDLIVSGRNEYYTIEM